MRGKMKTIHGIYKKHGRAEFLEAAKDYSSHVHPESIDKTIDEMESRWFDARHTMTEAEKKWLRTTTTASPFSTTPALLTPARDSE